MEYSLSRILSSYQRTQDQLIPILQKVQAEFGYLPEEAINRVAEFCRVAESKVFGIASFYAQFRFAPLGKTQVTTCRGTACHVRGAPQILDEVKRQLGIEEGETTPDLEYSLETVACIGCCALAPCLTINGKVEAKVTPKRVKELFAVKKKEEQDVR
ncbi:MAG: NADH-quinone oxidoreductase subunit NuoE [Dehalococcoidia bacterium]|nr:NADH-quinone oxidoreductase subunit NuoE [Dehalococcoidia bacterium]